MRLPCPLSFIVLLMPFTSGMAQKPEDIREHTSSLGERFVVVPGSPALFAIHETTVAQWQTYLSESKQTWDYKPHFTQAPDHPVVGVSLQDAKIFCAWLTDKERTAKTLNMAQSYRLPTQAEWDAAAALLRTRKPDLTIDEQVQDERTFPWGMRWPPPPKAANLAEGEIPGYEDGFPYTSPVGSFSASPEGLHDLAGNVWEWCWDAEIRAEQEGILRGGSWAYFRPECLRSSYTYRVPADLRMPTVGFRCVFEDKQRSAALLAVAEQNKEKIRNERRQEMLGAAVAKADVEAMKKKLMGGDEILTLPDASKLKPASAGSPFLNSLGMDFIPMGERLLVGKTEVRVQDFETWLKSSERSWDNKPPYLLGGTHPAAGLTWHDAHDFCDWLTKRDLGTKIIPEGAHYRLPTDIEWSHMNGLKDEPGSDPAARSGANKTHYPWSATGAFPPPGMTTNLDSQNLPGFSDSYSYSCPVTAEAPNELGILGLGGNVSEWCADVWPGAEAERVIRGGSWLTSDKEKLLTSTRRHSPATNSSPDIGFRVVLELPAP